MLIVKRRMEEEFRVGESVQIKVLGVRGGRVLLGVMSAADVRVERSGSASRGEVGFQSDEMDNGAS